MKRMMLAACALLLLAGCGLQTKQVHLQVPMPKNVGDQLKPIIIDQVTDARDFSEAPDGSRSRAAIVGIVPGHDVSSVVYGVGNKSGGFISVLADHQSVSDAVKDLVSATLLERGYRVVDAGHGASNTPRITVKVTEFWCFLPFSFGRALTWTQQFKAIISTEITVANGTATREFSVTGRGANIVQVYSEENIRETYAKAMEEYSDQLAMKIFNSL